MEFKIDAKDSYTVITPTGTTLSVQETALLSEKYTELSVNGSFNCILDLQHCQNASIAALHELTELASAAFEQGSSFVLTNLPAPMLSMIKSEELVDVLHYAPTFKEAVDVINMEILERDLFNESPE
jgi:hypothetical protein